MRILSYQNNLRCSQGLALLIRLLRGLNEIKIAYLMSIPTRMLDQIVSWSSSMAVDLRLDHPIVIGMLPQYQRAPRNPFPSVLMDCLTVIRQLRQEPRWITRLNGGRVYRVMTVYP